MTQIPDLSLSSLRKLYLSGKTSPSDVINSIYDVIGSQPLQPVWITLIPREEALARARTLPSHPDLPLYGVPFAIKDNIDLAGHPTTAACPAFAYTPNQSAFVVNQLQQAGAILLGKTNLDQFATGLVGTRTPYGPCSSVFDHRYISGGSSSGSAVAVAGGLVSFALGTDTAGSGRVPAAFNNIVGLKPSRGLISASGVVPACKSLDCVSIFALTCPDASTVLETAAKFDEQDPYSRQPSYSQELTFQHKLRIGIPRQQQLQFLGNHEYQRLYSETVQLLMIEGHTLEEVDLSPFRAAAELLYSGPFVAERFAAVGEFVKSHYSDVESVVASIISSSEKWTAADAFNAFHKLMSLQKSTDVVWKNIDVLVLPTTPTTYTIKELQKDPVKLNSNLGYYTNFVNLLDYCAVAVPAGFTDTGLPFGVSVIGQKFTEYKLLKLSQRIQELRAPFSGKQSSAEGWIELSVVGAHLSGQPLNHQLTSRGARYIRTDKTAADYRCFALTDAQPLKPGIYRDPGKHGPGIEVEVWSIHESQFGSFVAAVPPPLSIGTCELQDGRKTKGFLCEAHAILGMPEITHLGGWRAYLRSIVDT